MVKTLEKQSLLYKKSMVKSLLVIDMQIEVKCDLWWIGLIFA